MATILRSPAGTPIPASHAEVEKWKSICSHKDSQIYDLEAENAALRSQLAVATEAVQSARNGQVSTKENKPNDAGAGDPNANVTTLAQNYERLQKLHADLQASHEKCQEQIKRALKKYDEAKRVVRQWRAYIDGKINRGIAGDPAGPPIERTDSDLAAPMGDQEPTPKPASRASPDGMLDVRAPPLSRSSSDLPSNRVPYASSNARQSSTNEPNWHAKRVTSSQTTEGDENFSVEAHIKQEASDDEPVVVSERIVKRRRSNSTLAMPPPRRIKHEKLSSDGPNSAERPQELRSDDYSSPVEAEHQLFRMGTSDLDAMVGSFHTPRRRRLAALSQHRALSEEAPRPHPSHMTRMLSKNSSSFSDGYITDLSDRLDQEDTHLPISDLNKAPAYETPAAGGLSRQQPTLAAKPRGALRQLSPNVSAMPHATRSRKERTKDLADKAGYLAEDGDEDTSQVTPKPAKRECATAKTDASGRLGAMLDSSAPNKQTLHKRARLEAKPSTTRKAQAKSADRPKLIVAPSPLENKVSRFQRPRGLEKSPPPVQPEDELLRLRPASALRLSDFKLNPKYAGSNFAFADSIRGRETKRGLQGDSSKFIGAARAGNLPPTSKTDSQVLEDYLGENYADILKSYSVSKQRETLYQARAQEHANAHGKSRQAFQRRSTPPGFWRTEMPTTQEALEDREEAQEQEKQKVEERWREAMRRNGRWLFRDE